MIDESESARRASDYAGARAKAAETVTMLLARPESEQGATYLRILDAAGRSAFAAQDPRTANRAWQRVLDVCDRTLPRDDLELQKILGMVAMTLRALGDPIGARAMQEEVLEVFSRSLPAEHADLLWTQETLALTLVSLGEHEAAQALQEIVLEVRSRTLPDDDSTLQWARGNLSGTMRLRGDAAGARALVEKVLEVRSRTHADDHPDLQAARGNVAGTMKELGDIAGARALEEKVLEVGLRTLPDDNAQLQAMRGNLALTLKALGDLAGAQVLQQKVLEVLSRSLPDEHGDLQLARANLAGTLRALGDLAGARELHAKVLEVRSRTLSDDDPDLQAARGNLALTIGAMGDLAEARALEEAVLEAFTRTLPDEHRLVQRARNNLALTIQALGDLDGARDLQERVLDVMASLPDDHPDLQWARENLAWTIASQCARAGPSAAGASADPNGREAGRVRCAELVGALCRAQIHAARAAILESPAREAEERCSIIAAKLDVSLSFALGYGAFAPLPELDAESFVLSETTRGAAFVSTELTRNAVHTPGYAELRRALRQASEELAGLTQRGTTSAEFDRARTARETVERELVELARLPSDGASSDLSLDVESLARALAANEAAVGFRSFKKWQEAVVDAADPTLQPVPRSPPVDTLCAFVVHGWSPGSLQADSPALTLVDLGPVEPIEAAVRAWRQGLGAGSDGRGLATNARAASAAGVHAQGIALRELIFDPLLPALGSVRRMVVVLDDVLHLVPLDALPLDESTLLGDRWQFETRTTLTELLHTTEPSRESGQLLAFGAVEYGAAGSSAEAEAAHQVVPSDVEPRLAADAGLLRGGAWSGGFSALPGTGDEIRGIAREFRDQFPAEADPELCERVDATRGRLLSLAPGARWLHIATHGWFAPESIPSWSDPEPLDKQSGLGHRVSGAEQVKGMSPMLLCGLALAGANSPQNAAGRIPGLVTADELSTLDLSSCELVVLSACDTNVGEHRAGQGVASLQKALQMAGARSVITSLWKVPDEATKELMLDFYRRLWVEKKPKHQALWEAKSKLRSERDERGEPRYVTRDWAAWVLTGTPE